MRRVYCDEGRRKNSEQRLKNGSAQLSLALTYNRLGPYYVKKD